VAAARTLIHVPAARRGDVIEVRATIGHPMETGHRPDAEGRLLPRDILTRFECRLDGVLVCAVDLHPAVAANPYLAFALRAEKGGTLDFVWEGDRGFRHRESAALTVAAA
jgi:sulfur-oxidizing protein SoxZ